MGLRSLRYWMNSHANRKGGHGPREGAVLMQDGSIVLVPDLTDWSGSHQILTSLKFDAIEATFAKAPKGGWGGEAKVIGLRGPHCIYTSKAGNDLDACVAEMVRLILDYSTRSHQLDKDPEAKLDGLLASHDWYSAYSDDASVSSAGDHNWDGIVALMKSLPPAVAQPLFAKYAPKEMTCPV